MFATVKRGVYFNKALVLNNPVVLPVHHVTPKRIQFIDLIGKAKCTVFKSLPKKYTKKFRLLALGFLYLL